MSCLQTISDYAFRSIGYGKRVLPTTDITLCDQFVLIGSGMIWNIYFAVIALSLGFLFATALALAKASKNRCSIASVLLSRPKAASSFHRAINLFLFVVDVLQRKFWHLAMKMPRSKKKGPSILYP